MDRSKGVPGKRPAKTKGIPPPGDLFALGPRTGSEPNIQQKLGATSISGKRESTSLLAPAPAIKKPKILSQTQTFTPLGRPAERDTERRVSPVPPVSLLYEEAAIDVDSVHLLSELISADECNDYERVEGLLCGTVKQLRDNRSKPDQLIYLTLLNLARSRPNMFNSDIVIEAFCSLLKRDMSLNFKSKGNCLVSVLACNVMMKAYSEEENWPDDFVKVYVDDALGERVWVDRPDCKGFVDNIITAFDTKLPKTSMLPVGDTVKSDLAGSASPTVSIDDDDKMDVDTEKTITSLTEQHNIPVVARFPYQLGSIQSFVMEIIQDQLAKRQLMDASAKSLIRLMTATCGYSEVRQHASQKLELWLQNPKLARAAQELLMSVCMNCTQHDASDMEIIAILIKIRMKTKPLINHYLNCMRELLCQHPDNLRMVLTHTIYNELSTSRNPNNMSLIGIVFQTQPEPAARILAEIFQDLLVNKDDYLRALRALFREVVRSLRHDINFSAFCLGLMQERTEPKFTDMEPVFKERYLMSVTDLVTLSVLQAITPSLREAVSAIARGDRKDIEVLYNFQQQVAVIQRDSIWWMHFVVPKFADLKTQDYVFCIRKMLFMESAEQYCKDNWPAETDRGPMLRLAMDCPVLEDTLMRVLVIGLSRDLPLSPADALDFADILIRRAANQQAEDRTVLQVDRLELIDALMNLCTYRHPENIALPAGYDPPTLAISAHYWKAWVILLIISAFNPAKFGLAAWDNYPTLKCMIEMVMTSNYKFPPPTTAIDDTLVEEIGNKEIQVAQQEKQKILEFESYLAASTSKVTITEANSLLIAQLTTMDPTGIARRPPQHIMEQLRTLNDSLKIGQMLCRSRNPDFLLDIIQRQGTSQSMPWLAELVESSEGSLDVLPVQCLCEFLLHESQDVPRDAIDDESAKFEKHKKRQKVKKQQQLLSRLQALVHNADTDSSTTHEVMDYFLKRLSSTQASNRALATKGLSMVLSKSQLSPTEESMDTDLEDTNRQYKWLLSDLPSLPTFSYVKQKTCNALRQACQIESDSGLVSAYIIFLSQHTLDLGLQELDELALDIAQLIVERTTVINYILPMDSSDRSPVQLDTLESLIQLFVNYLHTAKEPDTEGYSWSNTQDQIILRWESGVSATMHILVVHAMIILLTYGPAHNVKLYNELLENWFPENGKPPSAFLLDTSEEALLLPDLLKLRMIRSNSEQLISAACLYESTRSCCCHLDVGVGMGHALKFYDKVFYVMGEVLSALQDLEPSQLLLFVQSFGIPVHSMSKLLQCLDNAVTMDPVSLEQSVIDKAYMAQLIEVQHLRGAKGGEKFYYMLTDGGSLESPPDEKMDDRTSASSDLWKSKGQTDVTMETLPTSHVVNTLLQAFDPSGRRSPDAETHYQFLVMSLSKKPTAALDIARGLLEIVSGSSGTEFAKSLIQSAKACSLMKLLIAKQDKEGVKEHLRVLIERLSRFSGGHKSPMAAVIHQYLITQNKREQKVKTVEPRSVIRTVDEKTFITDLEQISGPDGNQLELMIRRCMKSCMAEQDTDKAVKLASSAVLQSQDRAGSEGDKMLSSTASLFIDWLELLDPEIIKSVPDLQEKLAFARQLVKPETRKDSDICRSQPYLLALLTHQSSWTTLHNCIDRLLADKNEKSYDASSVLDFLWACVHIPKIWQGRERKIPKNQTPEDVLGLQDSQLINMVEYITEEAVSQACCGSGDSLSASQVSVAIGNRMELLTSCICDDDIKVRLIVDHAEKALSRKSEHNAAYQSLLLELYLRYPYLLAWLTDSSLITSYTQAVQETHTQMDLISHRLLTSLNQGHRNKKNDARMSDVNIALRKMAAEHPILLLRQLPVMVALMRGKTQFAFGEFRQRNFMNLYTYILGLLELLSPQVFQGPCTSLKEILEEYFTLLKAYAADFRQLGPIISKLISFLHQFVTYNSQRATSILQNHVVLLGLAAAARKTPFTKDCLHRRQACLGTFWKFKFEGRSTGKRQLRSNFGVTTDFSKKFEKAATESNKAFLEVMAEHGLTRISCRKPITPARQEKRIEIGEVQINPPQQDHEISPTFPVIQRKLAGYYEIRCELLVHPPEDYKLRDVKDVWVEKIKEAMSLYPSRPLTRIPVLVRPDEVSDVQTFKEADLSNKTLWCLGGNHMLSAVKQLVAEDEQKYKYLRNIDVEIYVGLTKEEALEVSTIHNQQQEKLDTTFQEKVMVARKAREIRTEDWKDKATELLQIINHKNYKKQNLSTVLSVASYNPENFQTVIDLFKEYEEKEGPQRSYPQNLFRSLQGQKDDTIHHYLHKAKGTNGIKLARAVMETKQEETMKTVFLKEVGISDWEEAKLKFPLAAKRLLKLTDLKMRGEYIPKTLLDLIKAAKDGRDWEEGIFNISIQVSLNDKNISNIDFVEHIRDKYMLKMLNDLEKGRNYIKGASEQ